MAKVEFDPRDLPKWAQRHPEVVKVAMSNLAYRCDVYNATTNQWKRFLMREASRILAFTQKRV